MSPLYLIFVALLVGRAQAAAPSQKASLKFVSSTTTSIVMKIEEEGATEYQDGQTYKVERVASGANIEVLNKPFDDAALSPYGKDITDDESPALVAGTQYEYQLTVTETAATENTWTKPTNAMFATQQVKPTITFESATPNSITSKFTVFDNYDSGHSYSTDGGTTYKDVAAEEFTISGLEPATKVSVTAKGKKHDIDSEVSDSTNLCTSPLAATVTEETRSGTGLTLKLKTGEGKTTGLYFEFLEDVGTTSAPTSTEGAFSEDGGKKLWKLTLTDTAVTTSIDVNAVFTEVPEGATYKVLPYYTDGSCPAAKYSSSFANKVSLEAMFVYGVVGLMALILRALGLDFCGWF